MLRCDDPEDVLLGVLAPGEPIRSDRPVCYRLTIISGNQRGDGIQLKAHITGTEDSIEPLELFVSPANQNKWVAMEMEPSQSGQSKEFFSLTSQSEREMDLIVMSKSSAESQYMLMVDTEAVNKQVTEVEMICASMEPAPFGSSVATAVTATERRCYNFSIDVRGRLGRGTVRPDPRLTFLARASARFELVEIGAMELQEAFTPLVEDIAAYRAICKHFDDIHRRDRSGRLRAWRKA